MKIVIVYDSQTGTTKRAAEEMGRILQRAGHSCTVQSISGANPATMLVYDLVMVGSWIKGWFIVRQRPTAGILNFISSIETLTGRDAVVFCTYKLAVGSSLRRMSEALEVCGARVIAQFKFRGPEPDEAFEAFARTLKKGT
jgi:flavodoxin